ncbi:MAG: hypothetical protein AAF624_06620 [Bacteroidota bacterium]
MMFLRWLACSALAALFLCSAQTLHAQTCDDGLFGLTGPYDEATDTIGDHVFERGKKLQSYDCSYYLVYQADGNLVVYNANDEYQWGLNELGTQYLNNPAIHFEQPGRLVVYNGSDVLWASIDPEVEATWLLENYPILNLSWYDGTLRIGNFGADEPTFIWSSDDPPPEPEEPPSTPTECPEPPAPPPAHSYGDVHIRTPDGLAYAFQATGEFVLSEWSGGVVQSRQEAVPGRPHVSVNTAAVMDVGGDTVGFYAQESPHLYVNGEGMMMNQDKMGLPNGGCLYFLGQRGEKRNYLVVWPGGAFMSRIILNPSRGVMNIGVARGESSSVSVVGLLGNLDGNPDNDLTSRGGETLSPEVSHSDLYSRFGVSWQVDQQASLFRYASGNWQRYRYNAGNVREARTFESFTREERQAAREACRRVSVDDPSVFRACLYDVAATGDLSFADLAQEVSQGFQEAERSGRTRRATRTVSSTTGWSFNESGGTCDVAFPVSAGFSFTAGERLYEPGCTHYLVYQDDGNLVIYNANDRAVRSLADLGLDTSSITGIRFLEGGRLVTMNGDQEGWSNGDATQGGPYYLALVNGVLRIGAIDGNRPRVIWSSQGRR